MNPNPNEPIINLPKNWQSLNQNEQKEWISGFLKQNQERIIPFDSIPIIGNEIIAEQRKDGKTQAILKIEIPKDAKKTFLRFRPKNPEKITLLRLKNSFSQLELFYYEKTQEKLFLSINGEWFEFENGNEGKLCSKILNYDKNISPINKRRRKRYRKK